MEKIDPLATGKRLFLEQSPQHVMDGARQARAESLRRMIRAFGRRLRSSIAIYLLPPRKPIAGGTSSREL